MIERIGDYLDSIPTRRLAGYVAAGMAALMVIGLITQIIH